MHNFLNVFKLFYSLSLIDSITASLEHWNSLHREFGLQFNLHTNHSAAVLVFVVTDFFFSFVHKHWIPPRTFFVVCFATSASVVATLMLLRFLCFDFCYLQTIFDYESSCRRTFRFFRDTKLKFLCNFSISTDKKYRKVAHEFVRFCVWRYFDYIIPRWRASSDWRD